MLRQRIVIFGAGTIGDFCKKIFRYDKDIVCFIDNDNKKWGGEDIPVYPPQKLKELDYECVVIAMHDYSRAVLQLEEMDIHNYVYYGDVYGWQYQCKSREILDKHVQEYSKGQYTGRFVKNAWMNHLQDRYGNARYKQYMPKEGKILDVGSGCGTSLFYWLLMGYDAHGLDCCNWKLEFCNQKIKDFNFPIQWKEHFHFGYGESLPFEDESFDLVTSFYVLEHVANVKKCLAEMLRVTKTGGVIFINAPDYRNSYEEHYGIDIGIPMFENTDVLRKEIVSRHESLEIFEELNFITKTDIISILDSLSSCCRMEIIDLEENNPSILREDGQLKYRRRIQLIVSKR